MPDRKTKPYHPRHFPDPDDPDSVGGFVVAANNDEYAFYHSGTSQDAALRNASAKPSCPPLWVTEGRVQGKDEILLKMMPESKEILRFRAEFPTNSDF